MSNSALLDAISDTDTGLRAMLTVCSVSDEIRVPGLHYEIFLPAYLRQLEEKFLILGNVFIFYQR